MLHEILLCWRLAPTKWVQVLAPVGYAKSAGAPEDKFVQM
jgi:hypothetical protein